MEFIYIFTLLMVLSGFLFALAAWKLYQLELLKKEMREKEKLENEVIDGLLELKKYSASGDISTKASDSYDLLSVALMYDVSNITIISDEGLPIVSTFKDAEEISAQFSALYDYASKILPDKLNKLFVKLEDKYVLMYSAVKNDIPCYVIIESKYELDSVTEKRLAREIMYVLDNYLSESTDDEEEYEGGIYIVAKEIANIDTNNNEDESSEDKKESNNEESGIFIIK